MQKPSQDDAALALAREDLLAFCTVMDPNFEINWHHQVTAGYLQDVSDGYIKRLLISQPPRHGKSRLVSLSFLPWYLGRNRGKHAVQATYSQDFANFQGYNAREVVSNPTYADIFGAELKKDRKNISDWKLSNGSVYYSAGVGGSLTGRGANILVVDDPFKNRADADSEVVREKVYNWFTSTAYSRLEKNGSIIVIQTRWHEDDLIGRLSRADHQYTSEHWEVLNLPALAEEDEEYRREGEPLWPGKYDLAALENIRASIGERDWAALYQQRPAAREGAILKRDWWKYYKLDEQPPKFQRIVQSWDTAYKKGSRANYSVCVTLGETDKRFFLLDVWRGRKLFPDLKRMVVAQYEKWRPYRVLVEDAASGQSLYQELARDTILPIRAVEVDGDKVSRVDAISALMEAGRVFLPLGATWVRSFVEECAVFPSGTYDDQVDALSQGLSFLALQRSAPGKRVKGFTILGR